MRTILIAILTLCAGPFMVYARGEDRGSMATTQPSGVLQWTAKWIGTAPAEGVDPPLPIFRHSFQLPDKQIRGAVMHICGLGQFELHLNGSKVGDDLLEPGWTNYHKTCLYVDHDVTSLLHAGENAIGVMLGNGMYHIPATKNRYEKFHGSFGAPMLIAELSINFADGSRQTIESNGSWRAHTGPITFSSIYGGEDFDARLEPAGWDNIGFDDSNWNNAVEVKGPSGTLFGADRAAPPVRAIQTLKPVVVSQPKPGVFVYDMGFNCSMMPHVVVHGDAGAAVRFTPGELLHADGTVSQDASGHPSFFTYTLNGKGDESWSPRFSYYGARYVQVDGAVPADQPNPSNLPVIVSLESQFISSTSPVVGEFSCSSDLFNKTYEIIRRAMQSNMVSLLTDCPHREKLGWLEQDHLVGPSLMYNFDVSALFTKISSDIADSQTDDGLVPDIAPEYIKFKGGFRDSPEWGSAAILIPWQTYQWYGNKQILGDHYDTMKRYVAYLGTKAKDHILSYGLGDWYDIGPKPPGQAQLTPTSLTATAFYYHDVTILAQIASLLNHPEEAKQFDALAGDIRTSFNTSLYHADAHTYATGSQCSNAIPLVFGLAPEADRTQITDSLVNDVRKHDNGLTAGDIGYRYLLRALGDAGRSDVIWDMNSRSDRPGYGFILSKGATALTEAWDARASSSNNHFMLGHIMEWFYSDLAGIRQAPDSIAFKKIIIGPTPVGDVTWAKAAYRSAAGEIKSDWKIADGQFDLAVAIPEGSTAVVEIPKDFGGRVLVQGKPMTPKDTADGHRVIEIESGTYRIEAAAK